MQVMNNPYLAAVLLTLTAQAAAGADRLLDPTRPANARAAAATTSASTVKVEAIMNSGDSRLAIVNGKLVRAGDVVDGARIDEVMSGGVRYTRAGQMAVAPLGKQGMEVRRNVTAEDRQ